MTLGNKFLNRIFVCLALALQLALPVLGQEKQIQRNPGTIETASPQNDSAATYGYAGVTISRDAQGLYFQDVVAGSPAAKSGLKAADRLDNFKIEDVTAHLFKSLIKTIAYNPHRTIMLTISRKGTQLQIPLHVSSLQECPNEVLLKAKREERKRDAQGTRFTPDLIADAPEVPQLIEFFDATAGPSSILLEKRLRGLKVLSLSLDDSNTLAKLKKLNLPITPRVVSVNDDDGLIVPFPIGNDWQVNRDLFYTLDYEKPAPGEFAAESDKDGRIISKKVSASLSERDIALRDSKFDGWPPIVHTGLGCIAFDGRGGHLGPSISPLVPVAHTWIYHNQNNFAPVENSELMRSLQVLVRDTIRALNCNTLDTKIAASHLVGEAKLAGNSIKAGSDEIPGLGKFQQLKEENVEVRVLSKACAVARVEHSNYGTESYFYLIDDGGWKVSAIRTPLEQRKFSPACDIESPSLDENWNRIDAERTRTMSPAVRAQTDRFNKDQINALHRSLMTDAEIAEWFRQHQADLDILAKQSTAALKVGDSLDFRELYSVFPLPNTREIAESIPSRLRALELGSVQKLKDKNVYLMFFYGRYSESGLLYSEDNCPPPVGPYGTIWTKKLADHFYLMRVNDQWQFPITNVLTL